jgi:hypothetical protein
LGSRIGWSRSILRLVCKHVNRAIPTSEYSLNMRDELVLQKIPDEFAPIQLRNLPSHFLPAPSFSPRSSTTRELGRRVVGGSTSAAAKGARAARAERGCGRSLGGARPWGSAAAGRSPAGARLQAELGRCRRSAAAGGPRAEQAEPCPRSSTCYGGGERGREKIG